MKREKKRGVITAHYGVAVDVRFYQEDGRLSCDAGEDKMIRVKRNSGHVVGDEVEAAGESLKRGWLYLFNFMGQLSVNLAVLNLLPVPVLDGGHLVFLTFEGIRGKPLGDRIMGMSLRIGIALLATLMLFVFYNDIARLVRLWMAP